MLNDGLSISVMIFQLRRAIDVTFSTFRVHECLKGAIDYTLMLLNVQAYIKRAIESLLRFNDVIVWR